MWNAVKGFGEVKEHKKGYSPALNSRPYVIEYSKQRRLCAVSFPVLSLTRREQVVVFKVSQKLIKGQAFLDFCHFG